MVKIEPVGLQQQAMASAWLWITLRVAEDLLLLQANVKRISCHGLALLLGMGSGRPLHEPVCCIDVRRADERTLYGCIPGALKLPPTSSWLCH